MSLVHVTRRPNPSIGCHQPITTEMGYKLPATLMTKRAIWWRMLENGRPEI